ncbi:MAG: 2-hydroxychromene-2-carboxylate isomerase [Rhizobiaceae bacterium]|nr:2-hydroxychromene-2-carboxylate isomerase [Rhizobiaceae bacterium]
MGASIDYYFISASPFAYLGHQAFHSIAARRGTTIRYRPMKMLEVWEVSGSVPVAQRSPTRQRYRAIELQRLAEFRDLRLNLSPKHVPVDPTLADRTVIALVEAGADPAGFLWQVHQGVWALDHDIADRKTLATYLSEEGHDAEAALTFAESPAAAAIHDANTKDAIAADVIGAPAYVLNGEPFWGQDRLDHLDYALASARPPFRPQ